jgi:pimeloyl-ACP methyl ester carboxylesterase
MFRVGPSFVAPLLPRALAALAVGRAHLARMRRRRLFPINGKLTHRAAPLSAPLQRIALAGGLALLLSGCQYVGTVVKQRYYHAQLQVAPRNRIHKHIIGRDTYLVIGRVEENPPARAPTTAVVAISDQPVAGEVVDVSHSVRDSSYYGLNLPAGEYRLLVVHDADGDDTYTETEATLSRTIRVDSVRAPDKVLINVDLVGRDATAPVAKTRFRIAVPPTPPAPESVFYPKGTIRSLSDPIFDPAMAQLGLYEPAAFMEAAPMMFYALEEDHGYKIPVIFVHGIGGSAREFLDVVAQLDRQRYRIWFFHYPSGSDLSTLGAVFYEIFLSGQIVPKQETPLVIVAHSMGGLVVREAFNHYRGQGAESPVAHLITLASPLGGHAAAHRAAHAPVVLPSWRDLDPASTFIRDLHRRPLPRDLTWHLFCALGEKPAADPADQTDGVVALTSQRETRALHTASDQRAFSVSHTGILHDAAAIDAIVRTIEQTKNPFPADHLAEMNRGGYDLPLTADFSPMEVYFVRYLGHYMEALVSGRLQPCHPAQKQFLDEVAGRRRAEFPASTAWLKFKRLYPDSAKGAR